MFVPEGRSSTTFNSLRVTRTHQQGHKSGALCARRARIAARTLHVQERDEDDQPHAEFDAVLSEAAELGDRDDGRDSS